MRGQVPRGLGICPSPYDSKRYIRTSLCLQSSHLPILWLFPPALERSEVTELRLAGAAAWGLSQDRWPKDQWWREDLRGSLEGSGHAGPFRCPALSPWRHFSQLTSRFPGPTVSERQTQQRSSSPGRAAVREHSVARPVLKPPLHSPRQVPAFHGMHRPGPRGSHRG